MFSSSLDRRPTWDKVDGDNPLIGLVGESGRKWKKVVKSGSCSPAAWRGGPPIDAKVRLGAGRSSNEQKLDL